MCHSKVNAWCVIIIVLLNFSNSSSISTLEVDSNANYHKKIIGKMDINQATYNTICDCENVTPLEEKQLRHPRCDPSKLRIHNDLKGRGANFEEIRKLVGNIENLNYVKIPESSFKCLDGRHNQSVLGAPGGDAGEFILALMVYEDLLGRQVTQSNVDAFLTDYLMTMKPNKFHMCTDDISVEHMERELNIEGLNIKEPKLSLVPELLEAVVKPENVGDLHLKLMIKYSKKYLVRRELVEMFIVSFYKILWNKTEALSSKLELEVLTGNHLESAFIEVRSEEECSKAELAPLLKTKNKFTSAFINNFDAVSVRRRQLAEFFSKSVNHHQDEIDPEVMQSRLKHHGFVGLEITGSYSAKGLPFYSINLA